MLIETHPFVCGLMQVLNLIDLFYSQLVMFFRQYTAKGYSDSKVLCYVIIIIIIVINVLISIHNYVEGSQARGALGS